MIRERRSQLFREVRDDFHDLSLFVTAPLYRRWHLRWGATLEEATTRMPGDELFPRAQFKATRSSPTVIAV
jgi:hypothetical protein